MITVRLKGGMGNQMFQYSFGLAYSKKRNSDFQLDLRYLNDRSPRPNVVFRNYDLDIFNANPRKCQKEKYSFGLYPVYAMESLQKRLIKGAYSSITKKYLELSFAFDPKVFDLPKNTYFDGYFQCFRYFDEYRDELLKSFSFVNPLSDNCSSLMAEIRNAESVCLNVRRGDFVTNKLLGVTDPQYYAKAVNHIAEHVPNAVIYVFSDEIEWCSENLKFPLPTKFISHEFAGKKFRNYFELMINCKHFIIPNSSFAWWAAYLSTNFQKIVITPRIWFNGHPERSHEIILSSWVQL